MKLKQLRNYNLQQEYKREKAKKKKHIEQIFKDLSLKYYISVERIKTIVYGEAIAPPKYIHKPKNKKS